jgi:hypothetical protein
MMIIKKVHILERIQAQWESLIYPQTFQTPAETCAIRKSFQRLKALPSTTTTTPSSDNA